MPADATVTISVNRETDSLTYSQIEEAARSKGMELGEFIIAAAAMVALGETLNRSWEQGQRGEFSNRSVADICRDARAKFEAKQQEG